MHMPNSRIPTSTNSIHSKQSHHSLWIHAWDKFPYHHMQVILKQINSIITSHTFKTKEHKQKVLLIGFQLFKNHANITLQFSASAWNCIERVMTITHVSCNSPYISTAMFSFCSFFFTQLCLFKDFSTIPYLLPSKVQDTIVTSLESRLDPHWSQSPGMPASQTERNSLPLSISPSLKQTNKDQDKLVTLPESRRDPEWSWSRGVPASQTACAYPAMADSAVGSPRDAAVAKQDGKK